MRISVLIALLVVVPAAAAAQDADPDASSDPTPEAPADAADIAPPPPPGDAPPNVREARQRVTRGEALFERGDYDAALTEFQAAYETIGEHPNRYLILYNIGQCHERRFRYDTALRYYQQYLEEGGTNADGRENVQDAIRQMEDLLALVQIVVDVPEAQVYVDERQVGIAPGAVRVPAGLHVLELRAEGYLPVRREIQVAAGGEERVELRMERLSEGFTGISPVFFWSAAGVSVAALITGISLGLAAFSERNDVESRLADDNLRWGVTQDDLDTIDTLALTADVFYAASALFAVGAIVLAVLTDWSGSDDDEDTPAVPAVSLAPVGEDGFGLAVGGLL